MKPKETRNPENESAPKREQTPWGRKYERLGSLIRSREDAQRARTSLESRVRLWLTVKCGKCDYVKRHDMLRDVISKFEEKLSAEGCPECKEVALKVTAVEEPKSYHPAIEKALDGIYGIEKELERAVEPFVYETELWKRWLKGVKGVGPIMAANMLTTFDPYKAKHSSSYNAYAGLHVIKRCQGCGGKRYFGTAEDKEKWVRTIVRKMRQAVERRKDKKEEFNEDEARRDVEKFICHCPDPEVVEVAPRRKRGEPIEWNPHARTKCWQLITQLSKARGVYYRLYQEYRAKEEARNRARAKKQRPVVVNLSARRKMFKPEFLFWLWWLSREQEGLETSKPYVIDKLGHEEVMKEGPPRDKEL